MRILKFDNLNFRRFFETYTGSKIPDESAPKKNYLPDPYEKTLTDIRENISSTPIRVSIGETTDVDGRYVGNIIVGQIVFQCHIYRTLGSLKNVTAQQLFISSTIPEYPLAE